MKQTSVSRALKVGDISPEPLFVRVRAERRSLAARQALADRIRSEFREMPGLSLTLAQASRFLGVSPEACTRIFSQLAQEGVVRCAPTGRFVGVGRNG